MQKKIIALAVAGLSTAAFAQTNVTIYGVADVSVQGTSISQHVSPNATPSGSTTGIKNNSSLIGFKGTEDLGNGNKALFQMETNVDMNGGGNEASASTAYSANYNNLTGGLRDTFVGVNNKYGTAMAGYLSVPYRATLTSFDVMPGATGDGRIETLVGRTRWSQTAVGATTASSTAAMSLAASTRATAVAYALPTLYGFNGSIAYTGNGGNNNTTNAVAAAPNSAMSFNLGWTGYGVNVAGAYEQQKYTGFTITGGTGAFATAPLQAYTSYLLGASYTGLPGLKASIVYGRNTSGLNATGSTAAAAKGSNNDIYAGVSYRFGNNEPRLAYANKSNTSGVNNGFGGQDGARQWSLGWGYYLSKRTQVYGVASALSNNANGVYNFGNATAQAPTGGQNLLTYGVGLRTNF